MPWPRKVLRVFLAAVAFATCPRVAGQLPPARGGASFGAAGSQSAALQDAVEGIAGLMQRFERLQLQLAALPPAELEGIARPAQQLHERFLSMQGRMSTAGGSAGPQLEAEAISFHKDLANFVDEVSARLGISGQRPGSGGAIGGSSFQQVSLGSLPQAGQARSGALASPDTERKLQMAMQRIQTEMQRFQVLHGKLQSLPQQAFQSVASQAQKLHEEFLVLQQRGISLAGDGKKPMLEADAAPYVEQLESYVSRQASFINQVDQQVQGLAGAGTGFGGLGYQGMTGARIPVPPAGSGGLGQGLGAGLGAGPASPISMPPLQGLGAGPAPPISMPPLQAGGRGQVPGQVTPATDARLSASIDKVVQLMQEFQGLAPQLARANPQALSSIAATGTQLDTRFRDLQQRGAAIAGDGSRPMQEADAGAYAAEMEAFYQDQARYVEQAKQILKSSSGMAGSGVTGRPGVLGGGLGSASLEDLRGTGLNAGSFGGTGLPGLGGSGQGLGSQLGASGFGTGNGFRSGSFGGFSGTVGASTTFPSTGFGGASQRRMATEVEASGLEALAGLETVKLDTSVLPNIGTQNK